MVQHRDLTGASLHEPKGAETAALNEVYHADGLGSGSWEDALTRVNNLNEFVLTGLIDDVSTASSNVYIVIPRACNLVKVSYVLYGTLTGTASVISIYKNGILQADTLTINTGTSGAGVTGSLTLSPAYGFTEGQTLELRSDGGATNTVKANFTLKFTAT